MRRRQRPRSLSWAVASAFILSCGSDHAAGDPSGSLAPAVAALVPAPMPSDVPGAAEALPEPEVTGDLEPLTARMATVRLPIPRLRAGSSARFTFAERRRGWFARLPEYTGMRLLTPLYSHGKVYLGGGFESHSFYALDARTGELDWTAAADDGGPTSAIIESDEVLFNTESCTLFAVDAETGRLKWKHWLGDPLMGQPAAANGRVFSGHIRDGGGYGFTAMDVHDGHVLWTRRISSDVMNAPVLDDTDVYFTTMDGTVYSFSQERGAPRFRARLHASSAPWLDGETVHVARRTTVRGEDGRATRSEQTVVLAKADGLIVRELDAVEAAFVGARPDAGGTEEGWVYEGSRPTIVSGRAYQTIGNEVQARDADTGELLWRRRYTDRAHARPASPPAIARLALVFGTRDGVLYGLDIDTGLTTFAYDVGEPIAAQPIVAGGWVYAATTRGGLVALEVADRTVGGWHMWGGNAKHDGPSDEEVPPEEKHDPTEGVLELATPPRDGELAGFPLVSTSVRARVNGFATRVEVEQTFENPYDRPVEAVYLFPLPEEAAVDEMELRTGDRVVHANIRRREQARAEYRAARARGVLASLLEQERENLFRQSIANIAPGHRVSVILRYTHVLPYEDGQYRFVFPMVAGPRYTPASAEDDPPTAAPVAAATGERRDRVHVEIEAELGGALRDVSSPTHEIVVERPSSSTASVRLREDAVPDRDLDVRFAVGGDEPELSLLTSPPEGEEQGFLTLLVHPKLDVPADEVAARELVFLVDTSSSMAGRPLELAKAAMRRALDGLRSTDTFRLLRFSDRVGALDDGALPATARNVARAHTYVDHLEALGATEMKQGIRAALGAPADPDRMRVVLLLTDGYIGNETEIFREVNERLGQARVFAFGVGAAVNRYLLTRVAEVGRGAVDVVTLDESPEDAADRFHARIATPFLTDVQVDWGDLRVSGVYPRRVPDLFADRPLVVHGRYARGGRGTITVRGRIAGRAFEKTLSIRLPGSGAPRPAVASLWARTRIGDLTTAMALAPSDALREEVIELGLRHHLLTEWTAFVAIDESSVVEPGTGITVQQAALRPAGGFSGLGVMGTGVGGGGSGYGVGYGTFGEGSLQLVERATSTPSIRASPAQVVGALSADTIRRVIRANTASFRAAYERALRSRPELAGRVTLLLVIGPEGTVVTATVSEDEIGDAELAAALVAIARSLVFPAVEGGGTVTVSYPLRFAEGPDEPSPD